MLQNEPRSWAEFLKQRESERNQPPPKEYYAKREQIHYQEAGVIPIQAPEKHPIEDSQNHMDPRFYTNSQVFPIKHDPAFPEPALKFKPNHDNGKEITTWKIKTKYQREIDDTNEFNMRPKNYPKAQMESEDYNIITCVPHESHYKSTIQTILKQRKFAENIDLNREFDPISNTFPSEILEIKRAASELQMRKNELDYHNSKLPKNERRAQNTLVNIITGEEKEKGAGKAINEFPDSQIGKFIKGIQQEKDIVENREKLERIRTARIGCRYNNGRFKGLRNWNIINGQNMSVGWDESVKMKPSIWTWCQSERLEV